MKEMQRMKEAYVTPKAELLEFNYQDTILTSSNAPYGTCMSGSSYSETGENCTSVRESAWQADVA